MRPAPGYTGGGNDETNPLLHFIGHYHRDWQAGCEAFIAASCTRMRIAPQSCVSNIRAVVQNVADLSSPPINDALALLVCELYKAPATRERSAQAQSRDTWLWNASNASLRSCPAHHRLNRADAQGAGARFLSCPENPIGVDKQPLWGHNDTMNKIKKSQVVVETAEYVKQAESCMDKKSREDFISYIARNPAEGALISGTGGARKIRWRADSNQGKSGGSRIIYYYHNQNMPIFLFTAYGKNQKENISESEKNILKTIIKSIVKAYGEMEHE